MIAYNKSDLDQTFLVRESENMKQSGFINSDTLNTITKENQPLKTQDNLLIRICLFILGGIVYGSICGVLALFISNAGSFNDNFKILLLVYAIIGFVTTELFLIKEYKSFGNGIDDAAILGVQLSLVCFVANVSDFDEIIMSLVVFVTALFSYLRYLHVPSMLISCCSFIYFLANIMLIHLNYGKSLLPFTFILLAGLVYFISTKIENNLQKPYYCTGNQILKGFCLILFYLAGNYFIVRTLSFELREDYSIADSEIAFSCFFWIFTFAVPIFYLIYSLKVRNKMMLYIGFLSLAFSFYSFRVYHHVLPPEIALTIAGLVLFAIAYFAIKKLKNKESDFTFLPDRFESNNSLLQLEVLASAAQFGVKPEVVAESRMEFGGGGFSGGGSGAEY